ncbi:hypothetical protein QZH41_003730 [Actinostola sp. cb2023]|nr:hypothetical protein QZH41_003730 [Actinostola sp. cb2023]
MRRLKGERAPVVAFPTTRRKITYISFSLIGQLPFHGTALIYWLASLSTAGVHQPTRGLPDLCQVRAGRREAQVLLRKGVYPYGVHGFLGAIRRIPAFTPKEAFYSKLSGRTTSAIRSRLTPPCAKGLEGLRLQTMGGLPRPLQPHRRCSSWRMCSRPFRKNMSRGVQARSCQTTTRALASSWDALLRKTGIELENCSTTQTNMHLFHREGFPDFDATYPWCPYERHAKRQQPHGRRLRFLQAGHLHPYIEGRTICTGGPCFSFLSR